MKFLQKNKTKDKANDNKNYKYNIITDNSPFYIKEAYKSLRTNIMFTLENETSKVILITSSMAKEGKSTVSINTAITFAQTGSKVILIDCDLRKPKVHRYLDLQNQNGLSNLLGGFASLDDVISHTKYGFDCITCGHIPPNPSELLSSNKMADLLVKLREKYDYILLDTPPVNVVTDTCAIGKLVDGAIFVVKHNTTMNTDVDAAIAALEFSETKILGFVFNSSPTAGVLGYQKRVGYRKYYSYRKYGYSKGKYGYYNSYKNYGGYGYGYSPSSSKTANNESSKDTNSENKQ